MSGGTSQRYNSPLELIEIRAYEKSSSELYATADLCSFLKCTLKTPSRTLIACVKKTGVDLFIYDTQRSEPIETIKTETQIFAIAFLSQDKIIVHSDRWLSIWSLPLRQYIITTPCDLDAKTITIVGETAVLRTFFHIGLWNTRTNKIKIIELTSFFQDTCKIDEHHYFECERGKYSVHKVDTGECVYESEFASNPGYRSCDIWSKGQIILGGDSKLEILNVFDGSSKVLAELPYNNIIGMRKVDESRVVIATSEDNNQCYVYDLKTGHGEHIGSFAFAMYLLFVVKGSIIVFNDSGVIKLYDVDKSTIRTIEGPMKEDIYLSVW
jgi:hypothetical protein